MEPAEGNERKRRSARAELFQLTLVVALALLLAFAVQAYAVKPYADPVGVDAADARAGPARARRPRHRAPRLHARDRRRRRLQPAALGGSRGVAGAATTSASARSPSKERVPGTVCAVSGAEHADEAFIKRVVAGPGDTLSIRRGVPIVDGEPVAGRLEHDPLRRRPGLRLPPRDRRPRRQLLRDGRQPPQQPGQPLLGPRAPGLDHRPGDGHVLAAVPGRRPLGPRPHQAFDLGPAHLSGVAVDRADPAAAGVVRGEQLGRGARRRPRARRRRSRGPC